MVTCKIATLDSEARREIVGAVMLLSSVGVPIEWAYNPVENETLIRISNGNPQFDHIEKENAKLKKELDRLRSVYEGCDGENMRLFAENERLKKELEEAKKLSLF